MKTFEIAIWGSRNCNKYPVVIKRLRKNSRGTIVRIGHSWGHWQTAMKEGRKLLESAKADA